MTYPIYSYIPQRVVILPSPINTTEPVNALVAFDTHDHDLNGEVFDSVHDAVQQSIPVYCERRLFIGENISASYRTKTQRTAEQVRNMLLGGNLPFDVFADRASEEQLIILPKAHNKLSGNLHTLGVDFSKVKWLSPRELLYRKSLRRSNLEDFIRIFDPRSRVRFRFVLTGHGNRHRGVAGLNLENYGRFLTFLQQKNTDALYIQTCNAGGINRTYHPCTTFPIFIENIGEFTSYYDGRSYQVIFNNMHIALRHRYRLTHDIASDIFRSNKWINYWQNLLQLRLPDARHFFPLNEDSSALVINNSCNTSNEPLKVTGTIRLLEVVIQRVIRPIFLELNQPIFLSLTAAESPLHIFESIHSKLEMLPLFQKTIDTFKRNEVGDHRQLLFIKRLTAQEKHYENVLVVCSRRHYKILVYNKTANTFTHYHPGPSGALKPHFKLQSVFYRTIRWILPIDAHSDIV